MQVVIYEYFLRNTLFSKGNYFFLNLQTLKFQIDYDSIKWKTQ